MAESFKFKFCAKGKLEMNKVATFSVSVHEESAELTLTPSGGALPDETVGTIVNDEVTTISGGTAPYTFEVTSGAPPDGCDLFSVENSDGSETLTLEGTPTVAGSFSFDVTVTDAAGVSVKVSAKKAVAAKRRR